MGKGIQVCQDIPCLILTHSADAGSENLRCDICNINMLLLDKTFKKTHYGEMCWYSLRENEGHTRAVLHHTTPMQC